MTVSPRYVWPPGGILNVPSVDSDDDVPTPQENIRAVSAYWIAGVLRVKLSDGTTVDVGPAVVPPAGISPRAVVGVKSALPDPPEVTFELGEGIITNVTQSAITFHYTLSCSVPIDDASAAVLVTMQGQNPLQSFAVSFPGGNDIRLQGLTAEIDEGGVTISSASHDFWLVLY